MKCSRCGTDLSANARFCQSCGNAIAPERPMATPPPPPTAKQGMSGTQKVVAIGGGALLLIALLGFVLVKAGVLGAKGGPPKTGVLEAKGSQPSTGVLQAEGHDPNTGVLAANAADPTKPITMPADIEDWLKHLQRCEQMRHDISKDAISGLMVDMAKLSVNGGADNLEKIMSGEDPEPPHKDLANQADKMRTQWNELLTFFRSRRPPQRCVKLALTFDKVLVETSISMLDITSAMQNATNDPQGAIKKLQGLRGTSYQRIDVPALSADNQVAEICREYNKDKWFVIRGDVAGQLGSVGGGSGF